MEANLDPNGETETATVEPAESAESLDQDAGALPRQRIRILYEKGEAIKYISHHDEFRLWERTLRRAGLPLLYKQGFNPQPHIQFASPLGVGITGVREPVDIVLSPPLPVDEVADRLHAKLPPGVTLHSLVEMPIKTPALQNLLIGADYTIVIYATLAEAPAAMLEERVAEFLAKGVIWRERERKGEAYTYNLRPLVLELRYAGYAADAEEHRLFLRVQQRAGATGRPDEVLDALGLDDFARSLRRDRLYYADREEDVALFAAYPVISQAEIAGPRPAAARRSPGREGSRPRSAGGRTISERAGDEFA